MDIEHSYARVHRDMQMKNVARDVSVVGVMRDDGMLDAGDSRIVGLKDMNRTDISGNFVEVRGILLDEKTMKVVSSNDFGSDFDIEMYYNALKLCDEVDHLISFE